MPKIEKIGIEIETGERGKQGPVQFEFNGHKLTFDTVSGGTEPNAQFEGEFEVGSFGHSVVLVGPDTGEWDIQQLKVTDNLEGENAYSLRFAPLTLDESHSLNLYHSRPRPTFDV